jgi:hypothetical protein
MPATVTTSRNSAQYRRFYASRQGSEESAVKTACHSTCFTSMSSLLRFGEHNAPKKHCILHSTIERHYASRRLLCRYTSLDGGDAE